MSKSANVSSSSGKSSINNKEMEVLDDVVLVIDGKELKTNSTLLAHNSSTFAKMIAESRDTDDPDTEVLYDSRAENGRTPRCVGLNALRIEVPNQRYSDMKLLLQTIQNHDFKPDKLTGEKALKIVPLTKQFKMKKMKKRCEDAMVDTLRKHREMDAGEPVPITDIFDYLTAADEYKLYPVKQICVELLSRSYSASNREIIVKDRHLSDKSKTEILNIMCDKMTSDYDKKLQGVRQEMERRCKEIEKKREESLKVIQEWKDELDQEVKRVIAETKEAHDKLKDDFKQKEFVKQLSEDIQSCVTSMHRYGEELKSDLDEVVQLLVKKDIEEDRIPPEEFWESVSYAHKKAYEAIRRLPDTFGASIKYALVYCGFERSENVVKESKRLQESFESLSVELADTVKRMSEAEANYQAEILRHENTKVELLRYQKRDHKVNTWIKWAKPVSNSEDACVCFRHSRQRQVKNS